jgi:hypothetical protein
MRILNEHKVLGLTYINPYSERTLPVFAEGAGGEAGFRRATLATTS